MCDSLENMYIFMIDLNPMADLNKYSGKCYNEVQCKMNKRGVMINFHHGKPLSPVQFEQFLLKHNGIVELPKDLFSA